MHDTKNAVAKLLGKIEATPYDPNVVVQSVRSIRRLLIDADMRNAAAKLMWFESETDDFPTGETRGKWNADALARVDEEVQSYCKESMSQLLKDIKELLTSF